MYLNRAKIRLDGEDVFGNKISIAYPKNKLQTQNSSSPSRGSANKILPQSIQDICEEVGESHSNNKGEDKEEQYDEKDEVAEDQEGILSFLCL